MAGSGGRGGRHALLMGAGNVGSHAAAHVARLREISRITVVDPDVYDATNLRTQDIAGASVGDAKARVQASRLLAIDGTLEVKAIVSRLEDVPLSALRADVLLSSPDSRRARVAANAIAWRHGMPWVDAGVDGSRGVARVTVRVPGEDAGCAECAFGPADYAALSWEYRCGAASSVATGAPSWLGALAASLQVAECARLLSGGAARATCGWQWTLGADGATSLVTTFRRNPACRFDHGTWQIEPVDALPSELTVGEVLRLGGSAHPSQLRLHGHTFATRLACTGCGGTRSVLHVSRRLTPAARSCAGCGAEMSVSGFDELDFLDATGAAAHADRALSTLGFLPGDVVTAGTRHFALGGPA